MSQMVFQYQIVSMKQVYIMQVSTYDGADEDNITNFRVDGQVSNIPLDEYIPYFLDYLPLGASIAKKNICW